MGKRDKNKASVWTTTESAGEVRDWAMTEPTGAADDHAESSHGSDDEGEPARIWMRHPLGSPTVARDRVKDEVDIANMRAKGWREVEEP